MESLSVYPVANMALNFFGSDVSITTRPWVQQNFNKPDDWRIEGAIALLSPQKKYGFR